MHITYFTTKNELEVKLGNLYFICVGPNMLENIDF